MSPNRSELESRIDELAERLNAFERRLASLERAAPQRSVAAPPLAAAESATAVSEPPSEIRPEMLPLVGRTILVLAGAFLLRAITEYGILGLGTGTAVGMAYAILWLVLADRAAGKDRRTVAMFHGIASAIIAFPLIWEATVRFEFLSPLTSAAALLTVAALGLGVAWRNSLRRLAWVVTVGAASTALVLGVSTRSFALFAAVLLLLGFATLWLGWIRGWQGPGWFAAALADLVIFLMTLMVLAGRAEQVLQLFHPESLVTLQLSLVLVYCGSLGARSLAHGEGLRPAEVAQGSAALFVGLGGAVVVTQAVHISVVPLGMVSLVLAIGCYAASFTFIDRRIEGRTNFIFYTTAAMIFTLVAFDALLGPPLKDLAFAVAGLGAAWLGAVRSRATLSLHGAVYVLVATVTSGLVAFAVDAAVGTSIPSLRAITPVMLVALGALAVCAWFTVAAHGRTWGRFSSAPKLALLAVLVLGVAGLAVVVIAPALPGAASIAVLRTGVLSAIVLALAWMGRVDRFREASWLVYPLLFVGAAKILIEDVPSGRASTLFLSLAFYGGALIVAPRLVRRARV